jgi:energy-coupling factor transporter transmembrane protein EcfT
MAGSSKTPRLDPRSILIWVIALVILIFLSKWIHRHYGGIQQPVKPPIEGAPLKR